MAARKKTRRPARHAPRAARGKTSGIPRPVWTGSISFGLLQIPVALYSGEQRQREIHFRLLDRHDLAPIANKRVNSETGKAVEWSDVVKGYEHQPGEFIVIDEDDLVAANVKATQTIDIQDFVPADAIEPAYFDTPYYAVPTGKSAKAFVLLRDSLEKRGAAAIASFVMRTRERLCALMAADKGIRVEVLRYAHELGSVEDLPVNLPSDLKLSSREAQMADRLIEDMMTEWQPARYKDHYYDDVMKLIKEKARTGRRRRVPAAEKPPAAGRSNVIDLVAILRKSAEQRERGRKREAA